jgi:phasin family protein
MAKKTRSPKAAAKKAPAAAKAAQPQAARKRAAAKPAASIAAVRVATRINTNTLNEGTTDMKNQTKAVADRVQEIFGDVNERAKTQIERNTRIAEELTELTKGNVEAIVASSKLAAKGVETLGQEVAEFGRKSFEEASAAVRSFAEVKSPTDLFRLQSEFARTQFDSLVAESSKMSEAMIKLAGEVFEPITSRYSVAAERVKNLAA